MRQFKKTGENFEIEGPDITLFSLKGAPSGRNWMIGLLVKASDPPSYLLAIVPAAPAVQDVIAVIEQDKTNGNLDRIARIVVSSRVAVCLFLDGTIKPADFNHAEETEMDTSTFVKGGGTHPVINLKTVQFGEHRFPVSIFSEISVGSSSLVTLDTDGAIV